MKGQWGILFALVIVLIIAIFSVINVDPVTVHYLFGTSQWPLILVIIVSALLGALLVGFIGIFRVYRLQRELKNAKAELKKHNSSSAMPSRSDKKRTHVEKKETKSRSEDKTENENDLPK
jgi:uncharacterized integral membrane protein